MLLSENLGMNEKAYYEKVEKTMFFILDYMYKNAPNNEENRYNNSELKPSVPTEYQEYFDFACRQLIKYGYLYVAEGSLGRSTKIFIQGISLAGVEWYRNFKD